MSRGWFCTSFEIGSEELDRLLVVEEAIFIELIHLFTKFKKNVDLAWLRVEWKFGLWCLDYSCVYFLVLCIEECSYGKSDAHMLKLLVFIDSLIMQWMQYFPHIPSWYKLVSERHLNPIYHVLSHIWVHWALRGLNLSSIYYWSFLPCHWRSCLRK